MKRTITTVLAALSMVALTSACKKKAADGELRGVDAITSGDALNRDHGQVCGPDNFPNTTTAEAIDRAYAHVPVYFQMLLPGGRAAIKPVSIDEVYAECGGKLADIKDDEYRERVESNANMIRSCYAYKKVDGKNTFNIYIEDSVSAVHGELISVIVEAVLESVVDNHWAAKLISHANAGRDQLSNSERKALSDLEIGYDELKLRTRKIQSPRKLVVDAMIADMASGSAKVGEDVFANYKGILDGSNDAMRKSLRNWLFAEFTESYFCSDASRSRLTDAGFSSALQAFRNIEATLNTQP